MSVEIALKYEKTKEMRPKPATQDRPQNKVNSNSWCQKESTKGKDPYRSNSSKKQKKKSKDASTKDKDRKQKEKKAGEKSDRGRDTRTSHHKTSILVVAFWWRSVFLIFATEEEGNNARPQPADFNPQNLCRTTPGFLDLIAELRSEHEDTNTSSPLNVYLTADSGSARVCQEIF